MGLLNVYQFSNTMKPVLSNRFSVTFYKSTSPLNDAEFKDIYTTFCVKSIDLPTWSMDGNSGRTRFGNTQYTIPVFEFAKSSLRINFIENDDMSCYKTICNWLVHTNLWETRTSSIVKIKIDEYDYSMEKTISTHIYVAKIKSITQPNWNNNGGASVVEFNADFSVLYEINNLIDIEEGKRSTIPINVNLKARKAKAIKDENEVAAGLKSFKEDQAKAIAIQMQQQAEEDAAKKSNLAAEQKEKAKDYNVEQEEVKRNAAKLRESNPDVKDEDVEKVLTTNAKKMNDAMNIFTKSKKLDALGIKVQVNTYNDPGHEPGLGTESGSHVLGQKIDLTFTDAQGNKINLNNMTAEEQKAIMEAAKEAGLIPNYETRGGGTSFWGDFALAEAASIGKDGKYIESQKMHGWVSENQVYDDVNHTRRELPKNK